MSGTEESWRISPSPSEFTWKGQQALARVHALNERCLELLTQSARGDQQSPAFVHQSRGLWRGLNAAARKRAAQMPFILMDVHFREAQWWRGAQSSRSSQRSLLTPEMVFKGKLAAELMRETLMLAWNTVSMDRRVACLLFGMAPAVSRIIADYGPQDVERIAARYRAHLLPRWHDFPAYWNNLLMAARDNDEAALEESRLHGVLMIGGALLPLLEGKAV
ncbi:hypothetical protein GCM10011488_22410 [Steroidobacter agaridevorans]|nr:hypothetical protein GCM10011488_22410 [Steroidobacter agaridevorans]